MLGQWISRTGLGQLIANLPGLADDFTIQMGRVLFGQIARRLGNRFPVAGSCGCKQAFDTIELGINDRCYPATISRQSCVDLGQVRQ